ESNRKKHFEIVYSGLLGVAYDFNTVLASAKDLQTDDSYRFLIRGVGEMDEFIRNKIEELNLSNVQLSTEFLVQAELIELLSGADALILPMKEHSSSDAGLPTKLIEYMATGRPIICISSGESARIVREAKCGVVVSPSDSSGLTKEIINLRENSNREELGANGKKYAEDHFSLVRIASKLEVAFRHAMSN
ncbi:MAG: glycosyltransferase, partial [Candidatus Thorarchaeota archaeon]